jgi:hypothetical protein
MKTWFISLFLFGSLLIGCGREDVLPDPVVAGLFNGQAWQREGWSFRSRVFQTQGVNTRPCHLKTFNIGIEHYNEENFLRQHLFVDKIPPRQGQYVVRNIYDCDVNSDVGAGFYLSGADGDVQTAVFDVVESATNLLIIERIDSTRREVSGRLQVTFAAGPTQRSSSTPYDTIRLMDCRFTLPINR